MPTWVADAGVSACTKQPQERRREARSRALNPAKASTDGHEGTGGCAAGGEAPDRRDQLDTADDPARPRSGRPAARNACTVDCGRRIFVAPANARSRDAANHRSGDSRHGQDRTVGAGRGRIADARPWLPSGARPGRSLGRPEAPWQVGAADLVLATSASGANIGTG